jgi:hypothetical protein
MIIRVLRTMQRNTILLTILVDFTVSANLLALIGSQYTGEGGTIFEKVHPGSYLGVLTGLITLTNLAFSRSVATRKSFGLNLMFFYLIGLLFCTLFTAVFAGLANVIVCLDTFLPAGLLGIALSSASPADSRRIRNLTQFLLALNALIAVYEFIVHVNLIPLTTITQASDTEFRSTGLYDHPLTGSAITMVGLWLTPSFTEKTLFSIAYVVLLVAALLAFGERTTVILSIVFGAAGWSIIACRKVIARHIDIKSTMIIAHLSLIGLALIIPVISAGISLRFLDHLYWDGSAQVRLSEFKIFDFLTSEQALFGCPRQELLSLIEELRLSYGVGVIENFWLMMFIMLGAICFPFFVLSIFFFLKYLWTMTNGKGHAMILIFMIAASCSNSLGHKSTLLALFTVCVFSSRPFGSAGNYRINQLLAT